MRMMFTRKHLRRGPGWLWPLALLALPGCASLLNIQDVSYSTPVSPRGNLPESSAVFCQIEQTASKCLDLSDPADVALNARGMPLEDAAIALVTGQSSSVGIDNSATNGCEPHQPRAAFFVDNFPFGYRACLNCLVIPTTYPTPEAFCQATCADLYKNSGQPGDPVAFCAAHARLAVNVAPANACYNDVCFNGSVPLSTFSDPRIHPDPVEWNLSSGMRLDSNGDIFRQSQSTPGVFDEGADSNQLITRGNAYLEFRADVDTRARFIGLSEGPPDPTTDYQQIAFAFSLFRDTYLYISEHGDKACPPPPATLPPPPVPPPSPCAFQHIVTSGFPPIYRIEVTDNLDGTAKIRYVQLERPCEDGKPCPVREIYKSTNVAHYPLRVDSSFNDQGGNFTNVRLAYIKKELP